jgi:hypothetical protein
VSQALSGVLKMNPNTDKKQEILFRLGNIYKQVCEPTQYCESTKKMSVQMAFVDDWMMFSKFMFVLKLIGMYA